MSREVWEIQRQTSHIVNRISEIKAEIERIKLHRPSLATVEIDISQLRPFLESDLRFLYKNIDDSDDSSDDTDWDHLEQTKSQVYFFPDGTYTNMRRHGNEIESVQRIQESYFQMKKAGRVEPFRLGKPQDQSTEDLFAPAYEDPDGVPPPPRGKFDVHESISSVEFSDIFNPYGYFLANAAAREVRKPPESVMSAISGLKRIPGRLTGASLTEASTAACGEKPDEELTIIRLPSLKSSSKSDKE